MTCTSLAASELSFSLSAGYMNGQVDELVYRTAPHLLSELNWKIGDVLSTRAQASGLVDDLFWFSLAAGVPILLNPGVDKDQMVDRDWLFHQVGVDSDEPSNVSWHRITQRLSSQWSGEFAVNLLPAERSDLLLGLGVSYLFWSWADLSYRYDYQISNGRLESDRGSVKGNAISYQVNIWFFELLLRWHGPRWGAWRVLANLAYSPYTVWLVYDSHLQRDQLFRDSGDFGQSLRGGIEVEWHLAPAAGLFLGGEVRGMFESQGYGDSFPLYDGEKIEDALARPPGSVNDEVGIRYLHYTVYVGFRLFARL